jgi:lipopolysaccharide transport system ATP-binding protein
MEVHIEISSPEPIAGCRIALRCCDSFQRKTLYSWIYDSERPICRTAGKHRLVCQIPKLRLYRGRYTLQVHLSEHYGGKHFQVLEGLCPFDVIIQKSREGGYGPDEGVYVEECNWIVESEPLTQAPSQRQSDTINRETLPHEHKWAES